MPDYGSAISKVLESETGKYLSKKIFGKINEIIKTHSNQREVENVLINICPIKKEAEPEIFKKIVNRYLKFRTLLSRDIDIFIDDIYHPLRIKNITKNEITLLDLDKKIHYTCLKLYVS